MRRAFAMLAALCMVAFASEPAAHAESTDSEARRLTVHAKTQFDAGHFREAADLLERAYAVKPSSALLYNLGRAYQQAGDKDAAIDAYQRYLASELAPADEGAVRRTVQQLETDRARERALAERAERAERASAQAQQANRDKPAPRAQPAPPPRHASPWPWVLMGAGAAGLATGSVLGVLATSSHHTAVAEPEVGAARAKQDSASRFATAANVAFVLGGAALAGGLVWEVIDLRATARSRARATLQIGPGFVGLRGTL